MLFFLVDIIALVSYLHFRNKVNEIKLQENVNEKLLKYYEKKEKDSLLWFISCMVINFLFFLPFL